MKNSLRFLYSDPLTKPPTRWGQRILIIGICLFALLLGSHIVSSPQQVHAAGNTYYVNNLSGSNCSDSGSGTSQSQPWCDFTPVNAATFGPGDQILLARGASWNQGMTLHGSGSAGSMITIDAYGSGAQPAISAPTNSWAIQLLDPSYVSVSDLALSGANGINAHFTTLEHQNLTFFNVTVQVDGSGILFDGFNNRPTIPSDQYVISGVTIRNASFTNLKTGGAIGFDVDYNGQQIDACCTNAQQRILIQNVTVTNDGNCAINLDNVSHAIVMDTWVDNADSGGGCGTGNYEVALDDATFVNGMYNNTPWTNTYDNSAFNLDNHMTNLSWRGDYFRGNAGSALEWTENCTSPCNTATDTGAEISDNAFTTNSTKNCGTSSCANGNTYYGDIDTAYSPRATGSIQHNLYYDVPQTYNAFFRGTANYTQSDNQSISSDADLYNAPYQFSSTQGQNQWSYQYYNGSGWNNISPYSADQQQWGCTDPACGFVNRFDEKPDGCTTCWVARVWNAPKAGSISIRGWLLKNQLGGDGVLARITQNGSQVWPTSGGALSLGANDQSGLATNVDLNVSAGDVIRFEVNNGGNGDASNDTTSWAPSLGYVSSSSNCGTQSFCNPSFETPNVGNGNFQYNPSRATWTFGSGSGISGNNSGFTSGNSPAPNGNQVAFLQGTGSFSQSVNLPAGILYTIHFQAAQRVGGADSPNVDQQDFQVYIDVTLLGTFKPNGTGYQSFSTNSTYTGGGYHTIKFVGLDSAGGDNTALIDNVQITTG